MKNIVKRGYVLYRKSASNSFSAIVSRKEAEYLSKRFGGNILDAKGHAYRVVNGFRVLTDEAKEALQP